MGSLHEMSNNANETLPSGSYLSVMLGAHRRDTKHHVRAKNSALYV